jgi:putative ABC transport system substrate-binding protein
VPAAQRSSAPVWKSLGWVDGETLRVERRYADWRVERMPELVDDLLKNDPEVLIAFGPDAAVATARATHTVPIVFAFALLPIEAGLIESYARPGRNATGTALTGGVNVGTKLMEFLRAAAPSARRLALAGRHPGGAAHTLRAGAESKDGTRARLTLPQSLLLRAERLIE